MTDFIFLDKDHPERYSGPGGEAHEQRLLEIRERLHAHRLLHQNSLPHAKSVDGDDFCSRCGLPLSQCNCKPRHG